MKIGVLGTGTVGDTIASKLVTLGHRVMMGSRQAQNPKALAWTKRMGALAQAGTFADAASFGELLFNCVHGTNSIDALRAAGEERLAGKVIVDLGNILPPDGRGSESLGEQIQIAFPSAKVVKSLNTMYCELMVDTARVAGSHTVFMSGNDAEAKQSVRQLLEEFGWQDIIDLGDITTSRGQEAYMSLWFALYKVLDTPDFNIKVVR